MSIPKKIGRNIVRLRKERRMTQEWLALEANMAVSYLRSIEHGKANPTVEALERLAQILEIPLYVLVAAENESPEAYAESYRKAMRITQIRRISSNFTSPVCPRCDSGLERDFQSFCDRCGQRLSWEKFSKAKIVPRI